MSNFRTVLLILLAAVPLVGGEVAGSLRDPQGQPIAACPVFLDSTAETRTSTNGEFLFSTLPGPHTLSAHCQGFAEAERSITVNVDKLQIEFSLTLPMEQQSITVKADATDSAVSPDPAGRTYLSGELLDANAGRPGVPFSIPGLPAESASGGTKAPQYFAPGVAGDHGEPIAQFIDVDGLLVPNNLSANAHGNGYADPNIIIPAVVESIHVDGGSFNIREGNHAVDVAASYGIRARLEPFINLTGDAGDVGIAAAWSPFQPQTRAWLAIEAAFGNGLLDTPEHRRQYKVNTYRVFDLGAHEITLLGIGYFGESRLPGLVPIDVPNLHDTIDPRQRNQTHTSEVALNDTWHNSDSELHIGGFFRTYNLSLYSNFGDGLIRQSEFRTVTGGSAQYIRTFGAIRLTTGMDYLRDAPRRLELDHYDPTDIAAYGRFRQITANNVTLGFLTPFTAIDGKITHWLRYDLALRRDQIRFDNVDLLNPGNSFGRSLPVNSPKGTLSFVPPDGLPLPTVALSFGQSFFTDDPRIGAGTKASSLLTRAHASQIVVGRIVRGTEFRMTLGRITEEQSLARIDADSGLQLYQGPGRNRFLTVSALHRFGFGFFQASFSKADARELTGGLPIPEAPRTIFDAESSLERLPFHLQAHAGYEQIGRTPLGDGFVSVPIREFRSALMRSFFNGRLDAGIQFLIARGFTGQTTEVLALPGETEPYERIVGVFMPSYATISFRYHFRHR